MKIYTDYIDTIKAAMQADRQKKTIPGAIVMNESFEKGLTLKDVISRSRQKTLLPSLDEFAQKSMMEVNYDQQLGLHPDFSHLKDSEAVEKHYIISVFIDVKGSTNMFAKYSPETVFTIINTIQKAAIHTCLMFGGYVHRLQGDGLFVYYGGKSVNIDEAVNQSLRSTSLFTYFVKHDLKQLFNEQGIDSIFTRIGIDLGHEVDVVWGKAGIGDISEITTCSLHTSLASKMQSSAESNGIVIGANVKDQVREYNDLVSPVSKRSGDENDRYIFKNAEMGLYYGQFDFNWNRFLKRQDFIATDQEGNLHAKVKSQFDRNPERLISIAKTNKPYFSA